MSKLKQQDINKTVWSACDTFRGVIDPSQYKDYILTMLFIKYISDVNKEKRKEYAERYDGNEARIERAMQAERFIIPENSSFDYLYSQRNEPNIGSLIDVALADLEEANRSKLTSDSGSGVFRNISFNSSNLGSEKDKNARLKQLLADFSELDLMPSHLANKDSIGDAYEYLIANFASDAGKKAGEFFTPSEVSLLLAKLTKGEEGSKIYDPTCGSGSLLIKAAQQVGSKDASVELSRNVALYGQENNGSTWALAVMNMFLHGFDNASIRWGDTIRNPLHLESSNSLEKFDVVVANPPFSLKKWGKEESDNDPFNRFWRGVPPKSRGDWAFVTHMIESAKEGTGKVGVVVPHGVLFRSGGEGKIREQVIKENLLEAVIGLPANLFFGTGIPASILIFNKQRTNNENTNVLFIDASEHYQSGTNQNVLREEDIKKVVDTYEKFVTEEVELGVLEDKYSYVATFEEIEENDFNLNIPRYVDTFEPEPPVDMKAVKEEINDLEKELADVQEEMKGYLEKLDF
ncbi:MAG TPA: type I restriction-modification system subunit M [Flavobacteriaceae bacterium]|nr:type I restriction-modification system subunit M [Flavobacteriaceae bacterium]